MVCYAPTVPVNSDMTVELSLRDDEALSRLVLDDNEQNHLDRLWAELRFLSREPVEIVYNTKQFIGFQPADRIENTKKFAALLPSLEAKAAEFQKSVTAAEPQQLDAVVELASRAWRRPLLDAEQDELRKLYELLRQEQKLSHDAALRTLITRILVSPHFLYRIERPAAAEGDVALAGLGTGEQAELLSLVIAAGRRIASGRRRKSVAGQTATRRTDATNVAGPQVTGAGDRVCRPVAPVPRL